jgi:hypothetical protein
LRWLLGLIAVLVRKDLSKDAELLVLRHENAVLRRQIARVRYALADRVWLAAATSLLRDPGTTSFTHAVADSLTVPYRARSVLFWVGRHFRGCRRGPCSKARPRVSYQREEFSSAEESRLP